MRLWQRPVTSLSMILLVFRLILLVFRLILLVSSLKFTSFLNHQSRVRAIQLPLHVFSCVELLQPVEETVQKLASRFGLTVEHN